MYNYDTNVIPPGYIDVLNYGGFFTRFYGYYSYNGKFYNYYVGAFPIGEEKRLYIPRSATTIYVIISIEALPGLWAPIFYTTYDTCEERCYVTYGVCVCPLCKKINCTSPNKNLSYEICK